MKAFIVMEGTHNGDVVLGVFDDLTSAQLHASEVYKSRADVDAFITVEEWLNNTSFVRSYGPVDVDEWF